MIFVLANRSLGRSGMRRLLLILLAASKIELTRIMVDTLLNPAECPERGLAPSAVPVPFLSSEHQAGNSSQVTKKVGRVGQVHSFCRFVGCGRVFEAHQFQSGRATEHRKRSWPGWSSWPSSLFGSVLQMSKSAKLANIDQIHSSYIFVGCGRVFESHQNNLKS